MRVTSVALGIAPCDPVDRDSTPCAAVSALPLAIRGSRKGNAGRGTPGTLTGTPDFESIPRVPVRLRGVRSALSIDTCHDPPARREPLKRPFTWGLRRAKWIDEPYPIDDAPVREVLRMDHAHPVRAGCRPNQRIPERQPSVHARSQGQRRELAGQRQHDRMRAHGGHGGGDRASIAPQLRCRTFASSFTTCAEVASSPERASRAIRAIATECLSPASRSCA